MRRVAVALLMVSIASAAVPARAKDCSDISSRVWSLSSTFEPNPTVPNNNAAQSPPTTKLATGDQIAAIAAVIDLAPGRVRADLCNIDNFYVDTTDHGAWGRWENPLRHGGASSKTEIVVNSSDFGKKFHERQDDHLKQLNGESKTLDNFAKHSEGTMPGRIDPTAYRLLYVMVHEMAHIRWHKASFAGDSSVCADDPNFYSWKDINAGASQWTAFGADAGDYKNGNIKKPKHVQTAADLLAIYAGGFVTALAATNPEEDFVESYAIRALIEACPDCVTNITIGTGGSGTTIRVNDDGGHPLLKAKFNCVYSKYIMPSVP
jgi:hypothetical protein